MKVQKQNELDLIVEITKKANGVGPTKASFLAEYIDGNWLDFLAMTSDEMAEMKNAKERNVLKEEQIIEIVKYKTEFQQYEDVRSAWIYLIGKEFLTSQIDTLEGITLKNLDINPFLMKVLDFTSPKEVLEFNLYQTVTRSIVTSWGTTVENLLVRCGAERFTGKSNGRSGRRPDIQKTIGKKQYFIQVKSGPNTMNVDMVNSLNEVITEYKKNKPNASFLLGMTYGTEGRISSQIRDNLIDFDNSFLIGRDLWDFVSEEKSFHKKIFSLLDKSSNAITSKNFSQHLDERLNYLVSQWQKEFGNKTLDEAFERYI